MGWILLLLWLIYVRWLGATATGNMKRLHARTQASISELYDPFIRLFHALHYGSLTQEEFRVITSDLLNRNVPMAHTWNVVYAVTNWLERTIDDETLYKIIENARKDALMQLRTPKNELWICLRFGFSPGTTIVGLTLTLWSVGVITKWFTHHP